MKKFNMMTMALLLAGMMTLLAGCASMESAKSTAKLDPVAGLEATKTQGATSERNLATSTRREISYSARVRPASSGEPGQYESELLVDAVSPTDYQNLRSFSMKIGAGVPTDLGTGQVVVPVLFSVDIEGVDSGKVSGKAEDFAALGKARAEELMGIDLLYKTSWNGLAEVITREGDALTKMITARGDAIVKVINAAGEVVEEVAMFFPVPAGAKVVNSVVTRGADGVPTLRPLADPELPAGTVIE